MIEIQDPVNYFSEWLDRLHAMAVPVLDAAIDVFHLQDVSITVLKNGPLGMVINVEKPSEKKVMGQVYLLISSIEVGGGLRMPSITIHNNYMLYEDRVKRCFYTEEWLDTIRDQVLLDMAAQVLIVENIYQMKNKEEKGE